MMTYDEMKEIAERYGIGVSQGAWNNGGFIDSVDGSIKESITDDLQFSFGLLKGEDQHKYYEVDAVTDLYAA